ncbi:protein spaetzle 3 isoform X2 [Anabrus simplex]|uniref:protein spaetzle 3 isoform X2 n=1 Tax=Anabrus simplex TaxID=316456 RepID=UPI0034DD0439
MALLNYSAASFLPPPTAAPFLAAAASASAYSSVGGGTASAVNSLAYSRSVPLPAPPTKTGTSSRPPRYYSSDSRKNDPIDEDFPSRPPTYTRVDGNQGGKTSLHAVLDYDDDFGDYSYEDDDPVSELPPSLRNSPFPAVTPIQGPIFIKNGSVPVVPLYSYPVLQNGSFVQIPILWTALSLALGLEIRGEIIRGVPCIKRFHQLFCPTAGSSYPIERIEMFIDENKALMKRMYGEFQMSTEYGPPSSAQRRSVKRDTTESEQAGAGTRPLPGVPDLPEAEAESFFAKLRHSRQTSRNESGRIDACESKVEIVTPYWASNSAGKIRAIVNTQHFEQAIHQEVCSKVQTKRCAGDCGCEQKYKWHRLLAYDPDNDCKGIFMDWFLFPSCCVCRCSPTFGN